MNKLVKVFVNQLVNEVVKIDTDTQEKLRKEEIETFEIDGGLIGSIDKAKQVVIVSVPKVNILLNGCFNGVNGVINLMLNKSQSQTLKREKVLKGVKFVEIKGVVFDLTLNDKGQIEATNNFVDTGLPYYTENNLPIK